MSCDKVTYPLKRGDTLTIPFRLANADDSPVDITGWTITSMVRYGATKIADLAVLVTDAAQGEFELSADAATTSTWKPKSHKTDVQFEDTNGDVKSSQTFYLDIEEDITYV